MAIHFTMDGDGDTLLVNASGFDESLEQVREYGMAIIAACVEGGFTHVFCDERELEYRLATIDTLDAAAFISEHAPRVGKIAIVCDPKGSADARFFEDVAVNRGLTVRAFKDPGGARHWLEGSATKPGLQIG